MACLQGRRQRVDCLGGVARCILRRSTWRSGSQRVAAVCARSTARGRLTTLVASKGRRPRRSSLASAPCRPSPARWWRGVVEATSTEVMVLKDLQCTSGICQADLSMSPFGA